jgi:uncharacterized protein YegP (UPF0339 family)
MHTAKATRPHRIEFYESATTGKWYWRMRAPNGKIVADGAESYFSKSTIKRALFRLRASSCIQASIAHVFAGDGVVIEMWP